MNRPALLKQRLTAENLVAKLADAPHDSLVRIQIETADGQPKETVLQLQYPDGSVRNLWVWIGFECYGK